MRYSSSARERWLFLWSGVARRVFRAWGRTSGSYVMLVCCWRCRNVGLESGLVCWTWPRFGLGVTQLGETSKWCVGSIYCSIFWCVRNIASVLWCYSVEGRYRRPFHAKTAVLCGRIEIGNKQNKRLGYQWWNYSDITEWSTILRQISRKLQF